MSPIVEILTVAGAKAITPLGTALVLAQAAAVAGLSALELIGLRRVRAIAAA